MKSKHTSIVFALAVLCTFLAYAEEAEEQAFTVFFEPIHYFQPLAADETLALLQLPSATQLLAISKERSAYRIIHEVAGKDGWLFRSYSHLTQELATEK